jgi:hypothetical protein
VAMYYNNPAASPKNMQEIIFTVHIANFVCLNQGIGVGIEKFPISFYDEAWNSIGLLVDEIPSILEEVNVLSKKAREILDAS